MVVLVCLCSPDCVPVLPCSRAPVLLFLCSTSPVSQCNFVLMSRYSKHAVPACLCSGICALVTLGPLSGRVPLSLRPFVLLPQYSSESHLHVCVCMSVRVCVSLCPTAPVRLYPSVCVCVCVCVRQSHCISRFTKQQKLVHRLTWRRDAFIYNWDELIYL